MFLKLCDSSSSVFFYDFKNKTAPIALNGVMFSPQMFPNIISQAVRSKTYDAKVLQKLYALKSGSHADSILPIVSRPFLNAIFRGVHLEKWTSKSL
jgi:hypothetical protein